MSKHFAMLNATRRLENHLSRESYHLNKMEENDRISTSLLQTKVNNHNELVDALNDLFAHLTDSPSAQLFSRYVLNEDEESSVVLNDYDEVGEVPVSNDTAEALSDQAVIYDSEAEESAEQIQDRDEPAEPEHEHEEQGFEKPVEKEEVSIVSEEDGGPSEPSWKAEGYTSYDEWLADKDIEQYAQSAGDLSLSVNEAMSKHRAQQALDEYNEKSERDIASYIPEEDNPINVLPVKDEGDIEIASATDYNYLDHTVDNVRVDNDPIQIAGVETAVERYGENGKRGTDIDVSHFVYQSTSSEADSLISDDIEKLQDTEKEDLES